MHLLDDQHPVDGYPHSWRRQKSWVLLLLLLPLLLLTPLAAMPPESAAATGREAAEFSAAEPAST